MFGASLDSNGVVGKIPGKRLAYCGRISYSVVVPENTTTAREATMSADTVIAQINDLVGGARPTEPTTTVSRYLSRDEETGRLSGLGGISPEGAARWVRTIRDHGHAITGALSASGYREGLRGHDDAKFCETGGESMSAYYENGETWNGGTWWSDPMLRRWRDRDMSR